MTASADILKKEGVQVVFPSTQWRNTAAKATLIKAGFGQVGFLGMWRVFGCDCLAVIVRSGMRQAKSCT
jgi:hypothetical protein